MNTKIIRVRSQDSNAEKALIKSAKIFKINSKSILDNIYRMENDKRKELVVNVAELTKSYSVALNKRNLQLLQSTLTLSSLSYEIACVNLIYKASISSLSKHQLLKRIYSFFILSFNTLKIRISMKQVQKDIDFVKSEIAIYNEVLDICKEYSRKLTFYLSFD